MWTIDKIDHVGTMANGRQINVTARFESEPPCRFAFQGTPYGMGPVFVTVEGFGEPMRVSDPERFGEIFDADWIRRYFA